MGGATAPLHNYSHKHNKNTNRCGSFEGGNTRPASQLGFKIKKEKEKIQRRRRPRTISKHVIPTTLSCTGRCIQCMTFLAVHRIHEHAIHTNL